MSKLATALDKVWVSRDGKRLCDVNDVQARYLFATKGAQMPVDAVVRYENHQRFFCLPQPKAKAAQVEIPVEQERPKRAYKLRK